MFEIKLINQSINQFHKLNASAVVSVVVVVVPMSAVFSNDRSTSYCTYFQPFCMIAANLAEEKEAFATVAVFDAHFAVDGQQGGECYNPGKKNIWMVDLGALYSIKTIRIANRPNPRGRPM